MRNTIEQMTLLSIVQKCMEPFHENDDLVKSYKVENDTILFEVDTIEDSNISVSLRVPSSLLDDGNTGSSNSEQKYLLEYNHVNKEFDGSTKLENVLCEVLDIFDKQRAEFIEMYGSETPVTPKSSFTFPGSNNDDIDEGDHVPTFEEEVNIIQRHSEITNEFFGQEAITVIEGANTIRVNIYAEEMDEGVQKLYCINKNMPIVLGIKFSPDYVKNTKVPDIEFKANEDENKGFGEQMVNIARQFITSKWKDYHGDNIIDATKPMLDILTPQPSNYNVNEQGNVFESASLTNHTVTSLGPNLRHIPFKEEKDEKYHIDLIKEYFEKGNKKIAIAHALAYSKLKIDHAVALINQAGGKVKHTKKPDDKDSLPNLILNLYTYMMLRIIGCTQHCCICDNEILVPFIKNSPTICTKFKCQFDYVESGICASIPMTICPQSIRDDILENENVVDLLISLCYCALTSSRKDLILTPFPEMYLSSDGNTKKFDELLNDFNQFPSVSEMQKHAGSEQQLKTFLGPQIYELLRWIISCNRPALLRIPDDKRIVEMDTEYQYMMLVDNPEKNNNFKKMRKEYGSYFAFHGSPIENWHSILRNGMMIASGTKFQITGAAYGKGIYLATSSSTSLGYSRTGPCWTKSKFGNTNNLKCLAVCEVAKHPKGKHTANPYYVIDVPDICVPRFFLFYPSGKSVNCNARDLPLHKYVH